MMGYDHPPPGRKSSIFHSFSTPGAPWGSPAGSPPLGLHFYRSSDFGAPWGSTSAHFYVSDSNIFSRTFTLKNSCPVPPCGPGTLKIELSVKFCIGPFHFHPKRIDFPKSCFPGSTTTVQEDPKSSVPWLWGWFPSGN